MKVQTVVLAGLALFGLLLASNTFYIVNEFERAVLLRLGKVQNPDIPIGLHLKIPLLEQVRKFDGRILTMEASAQRFLTSEKKGIQVDFFAKWRINDVAKYYTATNGERARAQGILAQRINESLRNQFASRTLQEVVSGERDELMDAIAKELNGLPEAASLGVGLVDVRVKRIDLPHEVSEPVYSRMRAEREREAKEHRAMGKQQAEIIRAEADRTRTELIAKAYRESEEIRGKGDADAAEIYASAYSKNPNFYDFIRSLNAYKASFKDKSDVLVLDSDSEFFKHFKGEKIK